MLDNRYPWADLKKDFLAWAKQHIRDWDEYEADLEEFEEFSHVTLCVAGDATADRSVSAAWRLAEGVTPRTINRQVGTIRNMLAKGVDRFKVIASNALADVEATARRRPDKGTACADGG